MGVPLSHDTLGQAGWEPLLLTGRIMCEGDSSPAERIRWKYHPLPHHSGETKKDWSERRLLTKVRLGLPDEGE